MNNENIRCWFRANIIDEKVFGRNQINIELSDFYGCLKDTVKKPLSIRLTMDSDIAKCGLSTHKIAEEYAKKTMFDLRQAVIRQAEQFFDEFYHYNLEDMKEAIKECIQRQEIKDAYK